MAEVEETPTGEPRVLLPPPLSAADLLFSNAAEKKLYWDRSHYDSPETQTAALAKSKTVYVGNLAFSTRSQHVICFFQAVGPVVKVHMGLDRYRKTPCGFCFVEFYDRQNALEAVASLSGCLLDGRPVRVELDAGFFPGRQYGRGASGGQVRDERRKTADPARASRPAPFSGEKRNRDSRDRNDDSNSYYGRQQPRPYPGEKRDREEDDVMERPSKNPRFRED